MLRGRLDDCEKVALALRVVGVSFLPPAATVLALAQPFVCLWSSPSFDRRLLVRYAALALLPSAKSRDPSLNMFAPGGAAASEPGAKSSPGGATGGTRPSFRVRRLVRLCLGEACREVAQSLGACAMGPGSGVGGSGAGAGAALPLLEFIQTLIECAHIAPEVLSRPCPCLTKRVA